MNIKPLHDKVVVKRLNPENKTASGIIIPDTAKEKPQKGTVIAVGDGFVTNEGKLIPLTLKVGDVVVFGKWGAIEFELEGEELLLLKESDVLAVLS